MSWVSSPSSSISSGHKHHHNHRLFCTYFLHPFTFYLQVPIVGGRVENPRHAAIICNQSMRSPIIWGRLWPVIQSQPSAACTTRTLGIQDSCILPRWMYTGRAFVDIVLHIELLIRKYPLWICQVLVARGSW